MKVVIVAAWFAFFALHASADPAPTPAAVEEKRAACNQDNLLRALQSPTRLADSYKFCSAYLSIPPTSTVTVYTASCIYSSYVEDFTRVHPLTLYSLQPIFRSPSPLSYNSASPTPITIPGGAQSYGSPARRKYLGKRDDSPHLMDSLPDAMPMPTSPPALPQELIRRYTPTLPPYIATTYPESRLSSACSCLSIPAAHTTTDSEIFVSYSITRTCTNYVPTPIATFPALCAPTHHVNAVSPLSQPFYRISPTFPVASKLDCCAACTAVFNCVWWKFVFGTAGDPWKSGACHYAYHIGNTGFGGQEPAVCPNGVSQAIDKSKYAERGGEEASLRDSGYNYGPCGGAAGVYESGFDAGTPDDYEQRYCNEAGQELKHSGSGC